MLTAAVAAAIMVCGSTALFQGDAANAQLRGKDQRQKQQQRQRQRCQLQGGEGERSYSLRADECAAVAPVLQAIAAGDWAAARAAIPAAQSAAESTDGRYIIAQALLRIGVETNDTALQAQAVDDLIASGGAEPAEMRALYENQLGLALAAGDTAKAEQAQAQLDAMNPNDPARFVRQAQIRARANDFAGAIALYQQAIQAARAAGQAVPVAWRQRIAGLAYQARLPDTLRYMREWLESAPSAGAWHDTLAIYAEQGGNNALKLDTYRLMRAAGAMTSERDFIQYAEAANEARAFGEVVAVLEEGFSRNAITTNAEYARGRLAQATGRVANDRASLPDERRAALGGRDGLVLMRLADAYFGYGQYVDAAELYRSALERGADANVANTRLGAALALAGQRAEAEAAFRAVSGPREELASLWLLWLSSRS